MGKEEAAAEKKEEEKKEEVDVDSDVEEVEEKKEEPEEIEEDESDLEPEPVEEEFKEEDPPKVELTADEKKAWHVKGGKPDLLPYVLSACFHQFSTPDKEEGFDEIRHDWAKQPKASEYVKNWVLERKLTTRIDDLKPGQWFLGKR